MSVKYAVPIPAPIYLGMSDCCYIDILVSLSYDLATLTSTSV